MWLKWLWYVRWYILCNFISVKSIVCLCSIKGYLFYFIIFYLYSSMLASFLFINLVFFCSLPDLHWGNEIWLTDYARSNVNQWCCLVLLHLPCYVSTCLYIVCFLNIHDKSVSSLIKYEKNVTPKKYMILC